MYSRLGRIKRRLAQGELQPDLRWSEDRLAESV
jgi:hypothetical protein